MSILNNEEQKTAENAEEFASFEALPAGRYACQLIEFHRHTANSGNESVKSVWRIADGLPNAGRRFFNYSSLNPEYIGGLKGIYAAIGAPLTADEADCLGRAAWVTVSEEADKRPDHIGEKQNKVKYISKYDGPPLPEYLDPNAAVGGYDADIDRAFGSDANSDEGLV